MKQPYRNPYCKKYESCLDKAARKTNRLSCTQCQHAGSQVDKLEDHAGLLTLHHVIHQTEYGRTSNIGKGLEKY